LIRRQIAVFLIVGSLAVLIDFSTYHTLLWSSLVYISIAKAGGFLTGTIFAYFANKIWTFNQHRHATGSILRFTLLYVATLVINVAVNALVLRVMHGMSFAFNVAFLFATGTSAVLNFIGMKFFVFKPHATREST
jgi:putative flippase GtrA